MKKNECERNSLLYYCALILALFITSFISKYDALALFDPGTQLAEAGITTELGSSVDTNLALIDSSGKTVKIADLLLDHKPLVLVPVYYRCPRLCGLLLGGVTQLVKDLDLKLGQDYKIATFSFNPVENVQNAVEKRRHYASVLAEAGKTIDGWDFYVGQPEQTKALIDQLGFRVIADGEDFAHAAAIFILDKNGRISQFFADIDFSSSDVRMALVEAGQGKVGSLLDQAVLFCFRFDPTKGKYTWAVSRIMQVVGALSILIVGGIIARLLRNERKKSS